jgi:FixJ family two-component response regulator
MRDSSEFLSGKSTSPAPEMNVGDAIIHVIDDDAAVRRALSRLLRSDGMRVEVYATADDFLAHQPLIGTGCVILDVQMPGMSGPDLQNYLADSGQTLPVIFLTGHGDIPTSVQSMKKGAVDFLLKPVDGDILLRTVRTALERNTAEQAHCRQLQDVQRHLSLLSPREREVLEHVLRGRLNKQIAADLGIAEKTVKVHRGRVMEKMETASLAKLIQMCSTSYADFTQAAE